MHNQPGDPDPDAIRDAAPPASEAEAVIEALRRGEADALVVQGPLGDDVLTLESAGQPFRHFVEQMQEGALSIAANGRIQYCNRRFADMVGAPPDNVIGRELAEFVTDATASEFRTLRDLGRIDVARGECALQTVNSRPLRVQMCISPLRPRRLGASCVVVTDLSHAERQQELTSAIEAAEAANYAKDQFLALLSHELRTPLSAVLGWSQVLREMDVSKDDVDRGLAAIERNARLQLRLIDDLLDVSRIVAGKLILDRSAVDFGEVVQSACALMAPIASQKGVQLTYAQGPEDHAIHGDARRLEQAVLNLLTNAVKFTPPGGSVSVALGGEHGNAKLTISDTGDGIEPDHLPLVFNRFEQAGRRRNSGLGLGLFVVREVVEMHGGDVLAQSDGAGRGSTFVMRLPPASGQEPDQSDAVRAQRMVRSASADREHAAAESSLAGLRVLVVDDNADSRSMLHVLLSELGARVSVADTASEARRILTTNGCDVLISDLDMPEADGFELIQWLRSEAGSHANIPAIALTALARPEDRHRALLAGFQKHVAKPFERKELVRILEGMRRGESEQS